MDLGLIVIAILLLGTAALAGPVVAIGIRGRLEPISTTRERKVAIVCVILVFLSFLGAMTSWRLRGYWPQTMGNLISYLASCALVAIAFQIKAGRWRRIVAASVLACAFLYGFAHKELTEDDVYEESTLSPMLKVRRSAGGFVGTDWNGVAIVYQPSRFLPIEKVLWKQNIGVTDDCDDNNIFVRPDLLHHRVLIECGLTEPIPFATIAVP